MGNVCDDPIGRLLEEDGREILDGMPPDGWCAVTYKDGCLAFVTAIDTDVPEVRERLRRGVDRWLADPDNPIPLDVLRFRMDLVYTCGDGIWRLRENVY